jgi:hypothetical protein
MAETSEGTIEGWKRDSISDVSLISYASIGSWREADPLDRILGPNFVEEEHLAHELFACRLS